MAAEERQDLRLLAIVPAYNEEDMIDRVVRDIHRNAPAFNVLVVDDGRGQTASDGLGRGITGIRERVKIYGGTMTTGDGPGDGFRLSVVLPVRGQAT